MSATQAADAIAKLQRLSEEWASEVYSLIKDLAELEALENAKDLKDAREALAEIKASAVSSEAKFINDEGENQPAESRNTIPYEQLRHEAGLAR